MKVIANFNLLNNEHLKQKIIYPNAILPNSIYPVIAIENGYYRVVGDNLDNQLVSPAFFEVIDYTDVKNWQQDIDDENFSFIPKVFAPYPYFWDSLHDGDCANSLKFANIYMSYLVKILNKQQVIDTLYQNYVETCKGKIDFISYWQKQWLKSVFKVNQAIQLRQFSSQDWKNILNQHFS